MNRRSFRIIRWWVMLVVSLGSLSLLDSGVTGERIKILNADTSNSSQGMNQARVASEHFSLNWNVLASGGSTMSSSHFQLSSTLGQPIIGNSGSSHFNLRAGYWQHVAYRIYLPVVLQT